MQQYQKDMAQILLRSPQNQGSRFNAKSKRGTSNVETGTNRRTLSTFPKIFVYKKPQQSKLKANSSSKSIQRGINVISHKKPNQKLSEQIVNKIEATEKR